MTAKAYQTASGARLAGKRELSGERSRPSWSFWRDLPGCLAQFSPLN
jgi:hypothetical protein